jgi:TPR repeat protein
LFGSGARGFFLLARYFTQHDLEPLRELRHAEKDSLSARRLLLFDDHVLHGLLFFQRRIIGAVPVGAFRHPVFDAGRRREQGIGVKVDTKTALESYESACRAGNADGCAARDRLRGP